MKSINKIFYKFSIGKITLENLKEHILEEIAHNPDLNIENDFLKDKINGLEKEINDLKNQKIMKLKLDNINEEFEIKKKKLEELEKNENIELVESPSIDNFLEEKAFKQVNFNLENIKFLENIKLKVYNLIEDILKENIRDLIKYENKINKIELTDKNYDKLVEKWNQRKEEYVNQKSKEIKENLNHIFEREIKKKDYIESNF